MIVTVEWCDPGGQRGGMATPVKTEDDRFGYFTFQDRFLPEVLVKAVDPDNGGPLLLSWSSTSSTWYRIRFENACTGEILVDTVPPGTACGAVDVPGLLAGCAQGPRTCGEATIWLPGYPTGQSSPIPYEMVCLSPGYTFRMGASPGERGAEASESPEHEVTIERGFWIGKTEVTWEQWLALMPGFLPMNYYRRLPYEATWPYIAEPELYVTETGYQTGFLWELNRFLGAGDAYRLPSEAEWEYAARGGAELKTRFSFGDCFDGDDACQPCPEAEEYAYFCGLGSEYVGGLRPNSFGLYDMHGNIGEWTLDWWHPTYEGAPSDSSAWLYPPDAVYQKVVRGGSFGSELAGCRSAARSSAPADNYSKAGFRIVRWR